MKEERIIKVTGCHDCPHKWSEGKVTVIWYCSKSELRLTEYSGHVYDIKADENVKTKTFHPDCPLEKVKKIKQLDFNENNYAITNMGTYRTAKVFMKTEYDTFFSPATSHDKRIHKGAKSRKDAEKKAQSHYDKFINSNLE